jgi:HK97 family phage major capsid protein/HK97 family phage prohead protease
MTRNNELHRAIVGAYLTRSITVEQINAKAGERSGLFRQAEVRSVDIGARTVELAFSSEVEVERWFGIEVLDHGDGSMRTDRLDDGAALLVNHDWDDQVGVVESVRIEDRRGRALVRFGKSSRADEIFQDVVDNIRKHVSVGYNIHKIEVETRAGQPDLVRVVDWEPFEISIVSVPADVTVGVGRSLETPPEDTGAESRKTDSNLTTGVSQMKEKIMRDASGNLVRAKVDDTGAITEVLEVLERAGEAVTGARTEGADSERARVRSLLALGGQYDQAELAREFVEKGKSVEDFRAALLDKVAARAKSIGDSDAGQIGLTDREVRQYSFMRVIRALSEPTNKKLQEAAGFEFEASRAAAERAGKEPQGIMIPGDVLMRALNTSTSGSAAGDTGGFSVATELMSSSFVELLRNRSVAMMMGRTMGGLVGNIDIPRQASGATGYWIGEDGSAPEDNLELDQIGMTPKTVAALSEITRRLMMQSSLDVEALVRADLATALALTIDKACFYGTGSDNQPRGIVNYNGINGVGFGASGANANPTYVDIVGMETQIAVDNADVSAMAYVMNASMRGTLKTTQKFSGTNGAPVYEEGNTVNGYRSEVTNQILNKDIILGNFADLMIGMWGGLDLTVDPYTHSAKGRLRIVAMQDVDVVLRRLESFCLGRPTP